MRRRCALVLCWALTAPCAVRAAPSADALARTCAHALAGGYLDFEAQACTWYVDPCTVCGGSPPARAWCVPRGTDPAHLAQAFVDDLATHPDLADRPAPFAIEQLFTTRYPCPAAD